MSSGETSSVRAMQRETLAQSLGVPARLAWAENADGSSGPQVETPPLELPASPLGLETPLELSSSSSSVVGSLLDNLDLEADVSELRTALAENTYATREQAADIIAEKLEELVALSVAPPLLELPLQTPQGLVLYTVSSLPLDATWTRTQT